MKQDFIIYGGKQYNFYIIKKDIKNINMKVNKNKEIIISAPKKVKEEYIKELVIKKINWIRKQLNFYDNLMPINESLTFESGETIYLLGRQYRIKLLPQKNNKIYIKDRYLYIEVKEKYETNKKYIEKIYNTWLKQYANNTIKELVEVYQKKLRKYEIPMPNIELKKMKTKWGSCIPSNKKVIFNTNIIKTPIYCIEYVVLHELSHFKYMNHSKEFYNFITIFMPDWKERKKVLDEKYIGI